MLCTYCPECDLFVMEATPQLSSQARQQVEEALRSFVKMAVARDRTAAGAQASS